MGCASTRNGSCTPSYRVASIMEKQDKDYYSCLLFLKQQTGRKHCIAVASKNFMLELDEKVDGTVWQVMPDDMADESFFDWYCRNYENEQFFENIYECVVRYLFFWKAYNDGNRARIKMEVRYGS